MKYVLRLFPKSIYPAILLWMCLVYSCSQPHNAKTSTGLPISTPEAEGVSSEGILSFLDAVEKGNNELHSVILLRHGNVIVEGYWSPYRKDLKHVMFSASKSFTSIGVGLAIAENKLNLTDKVISFFPNAIPNTLSMYMKDLTVQDLLKMSTGMNSDPLFEARGSTDWPLSFFSTSIEKKPGTVFKYNNMATVMLSAIVQKATGEKLLDFLKPRLFDPLDIKNFSWDETPEGYTFGTIGLKIQSDDMAKFGQMLIQKGQWKGQQIIPQIWVEEATTLQIETYEPDNHLPKELNDWAQGYGYQFWRGRNNSYRADGLGGQFIIVLPDYEAVVVLTSAASNTQEVLDMVWDHLLPAMHNQPLAQNKEATVELANRIAYLTTGPFFSTDTVSPISDSISDKRIEMAPNEAGILSIKIKFENSDAHIQIERKEGNYKFIAGKDDWKYSQSQLHTLVDSPRPLDSENIQVASKYSWTDESTMKLTSRFVEESIRSESWILRFEEMDGQIKVFVEIIRFVEFTGTTSKMLEGNVVY
ncbi:MAG TPA: serine hydrolase [Saprospiraceae bacterium]|nr:serine hydrolase [Saprospiraceae bacterium]